MTEPIEKGTKTLPEPAATARFVSKQIALRMRDPASVKRIVTDSANVTPLHGVHPWSGTALSHGYPGNILLFAEWDRLEPEQGWDEAIHRHLLLIRQTIGETGIPDLSLYSGWTGIAAAVSASSRAGERYTNFLAQIHQWMEPMLRNKIRQEHERLQAGYHTTMQAYDVIQGLAGIGRHLLAHRLLAPQLDELLADALSYLVSLTRPVKVDGHWVPGWYVPQEALFQEEDKRLYPRGNFNCGLAHGIPGPLALLSLALQQGIETNGQRAAIQTICEWLLGQMREDEYGPYWPNLVSFEEETGASSRHHPRYRDAWCYGTPGVARALYLAAKALSQPELENVSLRACEGALTKPDAVHGLDSPALCHGLAGLLSITRRMAQDTGRPTLAGAVRRLAGALTDRFRPDWEFGYRDPEPVPSTMSKRWLNKAGFLEGAPGVGLALLAAADAVDSQWDRLLLLS